MIRSNIVLRGLVSERMDGIMATSDSIQPPPEAGVEVAVGNRRLGAAIVDVWFIAAVLNAAAWQLVAMPWSLLVGTTLATLVLAAAEVTRGQTPGKALAGIRVQGSDGEFPTWRGALIRRSWMPAEAVVFVVDPTGLLAIVIVLTVGWSIYRAPDGRGWHDRAAGTTVLTGAQGPGWLKGVGIGVTILGTGLMIWSLIGLLTG